MVQRPHLIAVVDDEESVRAALARMLRASAYEVSVYASGQEFLDSLARERPDCVVMDFHMPGLSGWDVQRELVRSRQFIPLIIVTAHDHPALRENALGDGAAGYLTKPLRGETLVGAIAQAIRSRTAAHPPAA